MESRCAGDTECLGAGIAPLLRPGDVVLLRGDLGTGKTTLVRAAARVLGVTEPVTSPTFSIANRYSGDVPVAHLDAYRLGDPDDEELGLALEVMDGAVAFVEWPDSLAGGLPEARVEVVIAHGGGDRRLVELSTSDAALAAHLTRLADDVRARHRDARPGPGGDPR